MKDLLINTISSLGYPVRQQGSLNENEPYPDTFFTFWNNDTYANSHYDNVENNDVWNFDLNVYSTDPAKVNSLLLQAKTLLQAQGFIVAGKGYDVGSDEITHTGRGIQVYKIEEE